MAPPDNQIKRDLTLYYSYWTSLTSHWHVDGLCIYSIVVISTCLHLHIHPCIVGVCWYDNTSVCIHNDDYSIMFSTLYHTYWYISNRGLWQQIIKFPMNALHTATKYAYTVACTTLQRKLIQTLGFPWEIIRIYT